MLWSLIQQGGRQVANYLVFIVLAILLSPVDFGVVGIGMAWLAFIQVFAELGFGAALIQRSRIEPAHLSSTFYLNVGLGVTLTIVGIACSWPVAATFHAPEVQPVLAVLSANFLINSVGLTHVAIAQREMRFRDLAARDITGALCGGALGIILAVAGFGVWSLVGQSLATSVGALALIWRMTQWRPRVSEVSRKSLRELWGYSSKILSFNIFKYFAQNTDRLLVGYLLGPVTLGVYNVASRFVLLPVSAFTGAVGAYLFPRVSRIQEDQTAVISAYLWTQRLVNAVVVPALVAVGVAAPLLVPAILGDKWLAAVPLTRVFVFVAIAQVWMSLAGQLLKSLNRPGWLFNWSLVFTAIIIVCLCAGSRWGVLGIVFGLAVAHAVGVPVNFLFLRRLLPISFSDLRETIWTTGLAATLLGVSLWLLSGLHLSSPSLKIAATVAVGLLVYSTVLWRLDREFVTSVWHWVAGG